MQGRREAQHLAVVGDGDGPAVGVDPYVLRGHGVVVLRLVAPDEEGAPRADQQHQPAPTSMLRACASAMTRTAPWRSKGKSRSWAKWLRVPAGRTARGVSEPTSSEPTAEIVPSPPTATIASGRIARARRVAVEMSLSL